MSDAKRQGTPLADLVLAGVGQTEAEPLNDFILMARDVSNAYLVKTDDGDVLVNTGTITGSERTKRLFEPHRTGPLRYILLTQSHADHFGGIGALRDPGTKIVAERRFPETRRYYVEMEPFFAPRTGKLWARTLARQGGTFHDVPEPEPDIFVDGRLTIECGGRAFELISTPGGETLDSLCIWMPKERVVFTGNLFGPMFMGMPFLNTLRGDKPRTAGRFLRSLETVRALDADLLITGHGEPVQGTGRIRADLDKLHAAVSYVDEATKAGMNAGKDIYTLMREISLPPELAIGEWHGNVPWAVKAIWHEYSGWFLYESTTELYGVPRRAVDADIAELAGGADNLARRAAKHLAAGKPLEAVHLLDIALGAEPGNRQALLTKRDVLTHLLEQSGQTNLSETMWLKSEIADVEEVLSGTDE
ncbi:MAG: MBL fold metallo-hydrolase [Novosphingobium sp.]|nr:MBL fold metallo-hydrolase [Novosphingobium sp.]